MHVSRVVASRDLVTRQSLRRHVMGVDAPRATKATSLRNGRGSGRSSARRIGWLSSHSRRTRKMPVPLRSSDPENQTVMDEASKTEAEEETESKEEERPQEGEVYSGPCAEVLQKLKESNSAAAEDAIAEVQQELLNLSSAKSVAEESRTVTEAEAEELKAKYLRLNADFDNFRKRAENERDQLRNMAKGDVIESLLPLIDNFELARTQIKPQNDSEEAIVTSFMGLYRQMVDLFNQLGVEAIDCDQKPFDPEFHDAMLRELNNDLPDGTVLEELRKGFTIKGRLLRPAMVSYSDEVLQDTELPMDEMESTIELDQEESEGASNS